MIIDLIHTFHPLLAVVGIDDMIIGAIISAMVSGAAGAATPKYGAETPIDIPKTPAMDFNQLVQQHPSNLPKLQMQNFYGQ